MQIRPVSSTPYNFQPSFRSNSRIVTNKDGNIVYRNTTNFFRPDLNWKELGKFIIEKYNNSGKVNIICYACSDGSEPMSFAMLLNENLGEKSEKFLPIYAKDIDDTIIYMANSEYVNMDYSDFEEINKFTNGNFGKYFKKPMGGIGIEYNYPVRINPELKKMINFSVADITEDVNNIPSQNTIVFCRNFWPYIKSGSDREKLINNLALKLKNNCTIVTGRYDDTVNLHRLLKEKGFKTIKGLPNVYESKQ